MKSSWKTSVFYVPTLLLFLLFFIVPLGMLIVTSFQTGGEWSFSNYTELLTNQYYFEAFANSILLSVAVTVVSVILSGLLAIYLAEYDFKGRSVFMTLLTFPVSLPGVVVGFMIIVLFGTTGVIPNIMEAITGEKSGMIAYTIPGIFVAYQ
ncbi:MAG: ABC transporter permease, partial [Bacilli bacterium]